jgi:hypothetical protein
LALYFSQKWIAKFLPSLSNFITYFCKISANIAEMRKSILSQQKKFQKGKKLSPKYLKTINDIGEIKMNM